MSTTSHLAHTTSLCIAHIGKVNHNQRVISLILTYHVPRASLGSPSSCRHSWSHCAPSHGHPQGHVLGAAGCQQRLVAFHEGIHGQCEAVFFPSKYRGGSQKLLRPTYFRKRQVTQRRGGVKQSKLAYFPLACTHFQQLCAYKINHMFDRTIVILFISIKTMYAFTFFHAFQLTFRSKTKLYGSTHGIA